MAIASGNLITVSDLESIWSAVTSGINLDIDVYESDCLTLSFSGVSTTQQELSFVPPTDMVISEMWASCASSTHSTSITITIDGNINQTITAIASTTSGSEVTTELTGYLPEGITGLLAGDLITVTVSGLSGNVERCDVSLLTTSPWTRF
jgi:hypothetical protein